MGLDAFELLFFDSAREVSNDVNTFLNLKFIKKQKPAVAVYFVCFFLTKYYMYLYFCRKQYQTELEKKFPVISKILCSS